MRKCLDGMTLQRWQKEGMRQAKLLIGEQPSVASLAELSKFNRSQLRLAVGWLTGYLRVKSSYKYRTQPFGRLKMVARMRKRQRIFYMNAKLGQYYGMR